MKLETLKIVVSGAAGGMGRHFALRLAEAGAQVAIGDVNEDGLKETVAREGPGSSRAQARRRRRGRRRRRSSLGARARWAGLNGLINNAGILRDGLLVKKDKETGAIKTLTEGAVGRRHRREPHRRDASGARARWPRWPRPSSAPGVDRQHVEHRAARQPRAVELRRRRRPRSRPTRDLGARVRALRRPRAAPSRPA